MQNDFTSLLFAPTTSFHPSTIKHFWDKVNKTDGCWLWTGHLNDRGYGGFTVATKTVKAHRVSYELHFGPVPHGLFVCHRCDVRNCVNPKHLFLGTHADNMKDMVSKTRQARLTGASNGFAKLTEDNVIEIRRLYASGSYTQRMLADKYGISQMQVCNICRRQWWKHV